MVSPLAAFTSVVILPGLHKSESRRRSSFKDLSDCRSLRTSGATPKAMKSCLETLCGWLKVGGFPFLGLYDANDTVQFSYPKYLLHNGTNGICFLENVGSSTRVVIRARQPHLTTFALFTLMCAQLHSPQHLRIERTSSLHLLFAYLALSHHDSQYIERLASEAYSTARH